MNLQSKILKFIFELKQNNADCIGEVFVILYKFKKKKTSLQLKKCVTFASN